MYLELDGVKYISGDLYLLKMSLLKKSKTYLKLLDSTVVNLNDSANIRLIIPCMHYMYVVTLPWFTMLE